MSSWNLSVAGLTFTTFDVCERFFRAAIGNGRTQPGGLIALLWIGLFVLGASVIVLGTGLLRARG